jgi:hypothetical protein
MPKCNEVPLLYNIENQSETVHKIKLKAKKYHAVGTALK